jgi:hypothetical protein
MIEVKFTKNADNSVFYWDNPITEGKFDSFITEAKATFGDQLTQHVDGSNATFGFNVSENALKDFLNKHYDLVDDLVAYCTTHNITLTSPI